jgi:hypothetical protein
LEDNRINNYLGHKSDWDKTGAPREQLFLAIFLVDAKLFEYRSRSKMDISAGSEVFLLDSNNSFRSVAIKCRTALKSEKRIYCE